MELLIVRHAAAGSPERFAATGQDDALRPLTAKGRRRMAAGAKGLRRLVPDVDVVAASPLVRAQQTARILARRYHGLSVETVDALAPGHAPSDFLDWLRDRRGDVVAAVGHEPDLGRLVTQLMTGVSESRVPFGKGGACLLELGPTPEEGEACLQWALTGAQLRRLAR